MIKISQQNTVHFSYNYFYIFNFITCNTQNLPTTPNLHHLTTKTSNSTPNKVTPLITLVYASSNYEIDRLKMPFKYILIHKGSPIKDQLHEDQIVKNSKESLKRKEETHLSRNSQK